MNDRIFALFFVGICLLFVGAGTYLVTLDQDYIYYSMGQEDDGTRGAYIYEDRPEKERQIIDEALTGESGYVRVEDREDVPPVFVKKDGNYYGFRVERVTDHEAGGSVFAALGVLLGFALIAESFRQNYFRRRLSMPWDGFGR